jgi:hypothetical protein
MLPEDKSLLAHPILFQTPVINKQLDDNPNLIRNTNPNAIWDPSDYGMNKEELYDPQSPPIQPSERAFLINKLRPIARMTMDHQEGTMLFFAFMSRDNLGEIQLRIRRAVFENSGFKIGNQSESELLIAMQNIYKSYANNLNENLISKKALFKHIRTEVDRLDKILLKWVVPIIINSAEQRVSATDIFNNPVKPTDLPLPVNTSIVGAREFRETHDVLTGGSGTVIANTTSLNFP